MKFSLDQEFPAGMDSLWAVFSQQDYPGRKYAALGSTDFRMIAFSAAAERITVALERTIPAATESIPDWARKLVSRDYVMRHETRWRRIDRRRADAELDITPVGIPVSIRARGEITEQTPVSTCMTLNFEVQCRVPLIGRKVAELFAGKIREAMAQDHAFTVRYLQGALAGTLQA